MFSTKINKRLVKLTELGGGEEFYDIWKYYFLDVSQKRFLVAHIIKAKKLICITVQQLRRINH